MKIARFVHTLRPYQNDCINKVLSELANGIKRQAISLPVGAGKTVIFSNLIPRIPVPANVPTATRVLVVAHRGELLEQAERHIRRVNSSWKIIKDQASQRPTADSIKQSDVVIASVQTLGRAESNRIKLYNPRDFKCIIIDEAHHSSSSTYKRVLSDFEVMAEDSHILLLGVSATLRRHDGVSLQPMFQAVTYHKPFLEMIQEKYLSRLFVASQRSGVSLDKIPLRNGDFAERKLAEAVNCPVRNGIIVSAWKHYSSSESSMGIATRRCCLVFAVNVAHIEALKACFVDAGIHAESVHGAMKNSDRASVLKRFSNGEFPVLINCGILTEGVDIPRIDCIILARPTRSGPLLQQMVGRGLRLDQVNSKDGCLLIDIHDRYAQAGLLATVPSLLGLKPTFDLKQDRTDLNQDNPSDIIEKVQQIQTILGDQAPENMDRVSNAEEALLFMQKYNGAADLKFSEWEVSKVFSAQDIILDSEPLHALSPLAWVRIGERDCALSAFNYTILIKKRGSDDRVWVVEREILRHDSLQSALNASDTWLSRNLGRNVLQLKRCARWRQTAASERQIAILERFNIPCEGTSKGTAVDIMTRIMYGAKRNAEGKAREEKKRLRRFREVQVGDNF